jgi:hypothetical protein
MERCRGRTFWRRGGTCRPAGQGLALLAALACLGVLVLAASSAQAAALADGRAYELVTPPNKDNNGPYIRAGIFGGDQLAASGNAVSYGAIETFPGSPSFGGSFRAIRTSSGWANANVIPPQSKITGALCSVNASMVGYTSDMSKAILADGAGSADGSCPFDDPRLVPGEPEGVQNLFAANLTNGTYQLVDVTPAGVTPSDANYAGGSTDLSHVLFTEAAQLTPDAPGGGATNLYQWVGGTVSLVTQIPTSPATSCSGAACSPVAGSVASTTQPFHAVSDDGSMVYFIANGDLYARKNGTDTVQVDAPAAGGTGSGGGGQFVGASADGSKVFFTDADGAGLTGDTVSGSGINLYEYDVSTGQLTDLTPSADAEVQGFSGMSDDGAYIYFVANGSLAGGATAGQPNLYVSHNGATTFIAALNPSDASDWSSSAPTARASSNGQFVVFTSVDSLTGFNNNDANTSSPDSEIFRYDATSGELNCVSCSQSGAAPTGNTNINGGQGDGFALGGITILARYVSDTGQVFFDTPNALVPADTDGALDTYEYEAGQLSLISSGTDTTGALYVDSGSDGNNVLFATSTPLVAQDTDGGAYDYYDARVGGGFPVSTPTPPCDGESCKPPQSNPLPVPVPGTVTFTGPGNARSGHAAAKITLVKHTIRTTRFALRLKVSGRGRIVVSGRDIKRVSRSVSHAGTYTVIVHLTSRAKNRLKHKRRLKLSIRAQYVPSAGSASAVKFNLTVKA